ncbi:PAS domain-containing sensor histidine kinase [Marinospirillum perlucidum]|uniref:sensor histidine kinase n=1 Tax=Marinospirillum perlucidum TaxID=1982602 RepID=UPI000DF2182A|nr:PAS domain-containing sensor histidine kinase [Marinospirillum perlucidum]
MLARLLLLLVLMTGAVQAATQALDFATFFERQPSKMLIIDPSSGQILAANPAAADFYGYTPEQLAQMQIQEINTLTPEQVEDERQRATEGGRDFFIFRHRLADGRIKTVSVHSAPYEFAEGQFLVSVIQDLSRERLSGEHLWYYHAQLEEQVDLQTQALTEAKERQKNMFILALAVQMLFILALVLGLFYLRKLSKEKEQLLVQVNAQNTELSHINQMMAHHFQEPVRRISSFVGQLETALEAGNQELKTTAMRFIHQQAAYLRALLQGMQRYLELDSLAFKSSPLDVEALVTHLLSELAKEKKVHWQVVGHPWPRVAFSERGLQEVLAILLENAQAYGQTPEGLQLQLTGQIRDGYFLLDLEDAGQGIPESYRDKVFEPVTRLVPVATHPGAGMGLALARKLIQAGGGQLTLVAAKHLGGACFRLELPLAKEEKPE